MSYPWSGGIAADCGLMRALTRQSWLSARLAALGLGADCSPVGLRALRLPDAEVWGLLEMGGLAANWYSLQSGKMSHNQCRLSLLPRLCF